MSLIMKDSCRGILTGTTHFSWPLPDGISSENGRKETAKILKVLITIANALPLVRQCRLPPKSVLLFQPETVRQCRRDLLKTKFHVSSFLIVDSETDASLVMLRLRQCPALQQQDPVRPVERGKVKARERKVPGEHPRRLDPLRRLRLREAPKRMPRKS